MRFNKINKELRNLERGDVVYIMSDALKNTNSLFEEWVLKNVCYVNTEVNGEISNMVSLLHKKDDSEAYGRLYSYPYAMKLQLQISDREWDDELTPVVAMSKTSYDGNVCSQLTPPVQEDFIEDMFDTFDKVLVRKLYGKEWLPALFGEKRNGLVRIVGSEERFTFCIPYNNKTKTLMYTENDILI